MKTCSAFLVSLELQASSFFRLDVVCVHEACSVENATVVEIMGDSWKIANRCRRNHKIRTTCPTDVGFWQTDSDCKLVSLDSDVV